MSAAQHGAAVAADLQEDLLVVPRAVVLRRLQHGRQRGPVDDQPVVVEVVGQAGSQAGEKVCI